MLICSTWKLTVDEPMVLPRSYGLELVKLLHQKMNLEIGSEAIPTTTYAGILGRCTASKDFLTFHPGEDYYIRLSALQETSSQAIASLKLSPALQFLGVTFNVVDRQDEVTSYEDLYHSYVVSEQELNREFQVEFLTPTAFSQNGLQLPLPVPMLMFRSWLERWNAFAPVYLGGDDLINYFSGAIALKRHKIRTQRHSLSYGSVNGFLGQVTLQVLARADPLLVQVAGLLIHYAQFAGTGMKTRLGMGHVKFVNPLSDSLC